MQQPSNFPILPIDWCKTKANFTVLLADFKRLQDELSAAEDISIHAFKSRQMDLLIDEMCTYPWDDVPDFGILKIINRRDTDWRFAYSALPDNFSGQVLLTLKESGSPNQMELVFPDKTEGKFAAGCALYLRKEDQPSEFKYHEAILSAADPNRDISFVTASEWIVQSI